MRFTLIDRIDSLEPGSRIVARKSLSLAEEYLADHFPGFPVMPGVLMLEAMTQAGAWLIRATDDFRQSVITLREARNVKYAKFVQPSQTLVVTAEFLGREDNQSKIKASGVVDGTTVVSARLVLDHYNLADEDPTRTSNDNEVRRLMRELFGVLYLDPVAAAGALRP